MKHSEPKNAFDKGLKSMNNKFRISDEEQQYILNEINTNIDKNEVTKIRKSPRWKYYIASAASVFILILLAIPLFSNTFENFTGSDELSGKTFKVVYPPIHENEMENPSFYHEVMTLNFSDGTVVIDTIDVEGTYEMKNDELVIHLENEYEKLEFKFTEFEESDKDFSAYSTSIYDAKLEIDDADHISRLENLATKLIEDMPLEFIEE